MTGKETQQRRIFSIELRAVSLGLLVILCLLLLPLPAFADEFTGKVVGVTDGDTIRVLRGREEIKIRLEGIDCPESHQAFGAKAKQATSELAFGKTVTVESKGKDRYGRTLAEIILPDGTNLNRELIRTGFAWWYKRYSKDESLRRLETEARDAKLGLWADPNPVPPWEWRKERRRLAQPMK